MIPVEMCEITEADTSRLGLPVYPLSLVSLLRQRGLWSKRYVAFSVGVKGDESPSEIETILAGMGKVDCDVLASGTARNCDVTAFAMGKAAIVVYDTERLEEPDEGRLVRPNPASPSEYVALVVMPKVKESSAA